MTRTFAIVVSLCLGLAAPATAQTCSIDFTIEVTQGVGFIAPGTLIPGHASFSTDGRSFPQEGGTTGHMANGAMLLGDEIFGEIWAITTTSNGTASDMVGVFARDVEGFSFAGVRYEGPMSLTLFGLPGTRPVTDPPTTQAEWDALDLRRAFSLQAHGTDMLAGNVLDLVANCV
jgi:hypothetical protein